MPLTVFAIWIVTNTVLLLKAITAQEAEDAATATDLASDGSLKTMASDIRQLKTEVARLAGHVPTT
jgi:hypothetical protein